MGFADATVRAACPSGRSSGARPSGIGSAAARCPLFLTGWAILQCGKDLAGAGVRFYKRFSLAPYQQRLQWLINGRRPERVGWGTPWIGVPSAADAWLGPGASAEASMRSRSGRAGAAKEAARTFNGRAKTAACAYPSSTSSYKNRSIYRVGTTAPASASVCTSESLRPSSAAFQRGTLLATAGLHRFMGRAQGLQNRVHAGYQ